MKMLKKNEVPEGFVDRLTALKMLDVSKTHFTEIIPTLNIETLKIGHACYYKLSDIEKFIEDFKDFYDNHIPLKDVIDKFGRAYLDKNGISPSRIPSKYLGVFRQDMTKFKKTSKCFKKSDIEKLISKLENETDGYINRSSAMTMLDTTDNYIHLAVDKFNINTLNHGGIFYNVEDIKNAITEVEKFHKDHYSRKYVIDNFIKKDELKKINFEKVPIKKHYVYILKTKYKVNNLEIFYKKEDVDNYVKEHDTSGFVDEKTAVSMFETTTTFFKNNNIANTFGIRTKKKSNSTVYNLEDINKALEDCKSFYDEYYPRSAVIKKISTVTLTKRNIESVTIPSKYRCLLQKTYDTATSKVAYSKNDIDSLFEELKSSKYYNINLRLKKETKNVSLDEARDLINSGKYVTTVEACEKLSIKESYVKTVLKHCRDENILDYVYTKATGYIYKVSDIESLIKKRKEFFEKNIPVGPLAHKYFENHGTTYNAHNKKVKRYKVPTEYKGACELYGTSYGQHGYLKKIEIDEYLANLVNRKQKKVQTDKVGANPFETFLIRLADYPLWSEFKEGSEYTRQMLINFIQRKLLKGTMSERTCNAKIREYINLTVNVNEILIRHNVNEIFLVTTNEINLYMNTLPVNVQRNELYLYLKEVHQNLQLNGLLSKSKFSIDKIKNPLQKDISDAELENYSKEIYDFETYAKVFKYITDIDTHVNRIINEPFLDNAVIYASTWLYSMLHLNNAWRHGDCTTFPELNIRDLVDEYGITGIEWFENNKLTLPQAVSIIFRVRQWEMRISKTQMKGVFFCSDDLAPTFATAVIILHLFKYNTNVIDDLNLDEKDKRIMNFYNSDNEPTEAILKNFFKESKIEGFKFASRKFNRTIMTYIYLLANLSGDAKALAYVQEIRRHLKIESSMNYVDFDIKQVELLSRQLFERGEFGYIPTLLSQKILGSGKTGTFEEITYQTMRINAIFGDIQKINNTVSSLNKINAERQEVFDMLSEKTFEETQIITTDMFARNLSSKYGSDIQCLFSKEGCQRIDLDDKDEDECSCFDCPYHIPSIYTLTTLCNSLANNYKDYIGLPRNIKLKDSKEYFKLHPSEKTTLTKKSRMQIGLKIERRKILLIEAIQKFGPEYVYSCLDIDREEFLKLSDIVALDFNKNYPNLLTTY